MISTANLFISGLLALLGSASSLSAAITVYFYGVNSPNDTSPNPSPLYIGPGSGGMYVATGGGVNLSIAGGFGDPFFYRSDATLIPDGRTGNVLYFSIELQGGAIPGDQNYSYLKFGEGYFEPFESIAQFHFEEDGTGWLVAIATTNTGTTASNIRGNSDGRRTTVAEGAAAIAEASIPEPSSTVFLAGGILVGFTRRRRGKASL
ncbi:PEP-CTERM sorting domain-containing protein [Luteolibacter arcticus]|uniref:PEP-CTERM sorting domain-containing protein n=1 Tax=Luteolibacter arcticus TaxID=1581411 RepID=A0ABT3GJH1_9BACT|nr:PEP-CTERM sorting domain-containing protein [Luteolibacter arcticus]MCW1923653.1 PEP-CTERM sorting domain-containing protein [Luteolibacter arcticus]